MIVIVDYGLGNLASVKNMLLKAGATAQISSDPDAIRAASRLVLPGVGAFDHGMSNLAERGLTAVLNDAVLARHVPILGICLGMQLMSRGSEEGIKPGLGWVAADTVRFDFASEVKPPRIPHMGWNTVTKAHDTFMSDPLPDDARFYFVHSYHVRCDDPADVALTTRYGTEMVAAVVKGNIAGTQFHPEKSHNFGLTLLRSFLAWQPQAAGEPA
ncbi:MAG: imidazole glycerol phosphate synthase subunit HisH [Acidobacteriota bacterium]|nr:imidazole glycerol phosphate synthase subunit HisH [Acidobacteriota bacterium]